MAWPGVDEFVRAVETHLALVDLNNVQDREQTAGKIHDILIEVVKETKRPTVEQDTEVYRLLDMCRIFMRDRRGIDKLLSAEMLDTFIVLASKQSYSYRVREEALKCMVNSVYSRPEFVSETLVSKGFMSRLMELSKREATMALHSLVWRIVLVSCEAPEVPRYLSNSVEIWQLIYATIFYAFYGNQADIVVEDCTALLLNLIKVVTILANELQWTEEQEKLSPEVYRSVHKLGGLLLDILRFQHSKISPLHENLIEIKSKTMEVFMLLPGSLLAAFIRQQQCSAENENTDGKLGSLLSPVINHLHSMLLLVRIEQTRPLEAILPTLVVCHNLAKAHDPDLLVCFKAAVLPAPQSTHTQVNSNQPPGCDRTRTFFFKHLKFFLTCLDTDVRRYASEWLFLLCNQNAKDYTHYVGLGNAIGLLRTKGLA